jgi:rsbT antagonist protein RsbS
MKESPMMGERISVIRLRDVLLVTMPTNPDDPTISALQDEVLHAMEMSDSKGLVLDLSSVDTLDSFFARTLAETAQMVALMGGRTIIVGMRPGVAITATELGLTLGDAHTALNVECALDKLSGIGHERRHS